MSLEIERKFLVIKKKLPRDVQGEHICQAYLTAETSRSVRVRMVGGKAFLTIKGPADGISRKEFEYTIPVDDAREMAELAGYPAIEKTRYKIIHAGNLWEVDIFHGDNEGLVLAEIELQSEKQFVELPDWIGKEVSGDPRYLNSYLVKHPFKSWNEKNMV